MEIPTIKPPFPLEVEVFLCGLAWEAAVI